MADGIPPESGSALVSSPSDSSTASGLSAFLSSDSYIVWVVFLIGVISLAVALFSKKKR